MIWVWLIHGKTSRCSKFINDINKHSHANLYLFVSLLNWNTCVCRNFGKQNIVGTNGIPKFFFFKGSIAILTWGFSRSCFTNPLASNLKWDGSYEYFWWKSFHVFLCRNPTLRQVWGWDSHSQKVGIGSSPGLPQLQSSTAEGKTPCLEVFFILLESSWSVDVQNGLAWAIWTFAAQVMGKRRAESQTGSLTPDH